MAKWIIDFCEDNLQRVAGAREASERLKEQIKHIVLNEASSIRFINQRCIGACRDCHRQGLILRLNDSLICGVTHDEVIEVVLQKIKSETIDN